VAQRDEALCALLRQPILLSDDLKAKSSDALLGMEAWIVVIVPLLWEDLPDLRMPQCLERTGDRNLLMFHQVVHFLWMKNLLYHLHTASQSLIKILCGEGGCLPVGLEMFAVIYESSKVCNDSDGSVQLGKSFCNVFWSL